MSTVAAKALEEARPEGLTPVSLGYDRVRFVKPVDPGQTFSALRIRGLGPRSSSRDAMLEASVQDEVVAVGQHAVNWTRSEAPSSEGSRNWCGAGHARTDRHHAHPDSPGVPQ